MDFGASPSGFEAHLCHGEPMGSWFHLLVSFFIYLKSNAVILYKFWRPQPSLPCLGLQYSISSKTRTTVSLSSMQVVFAEADMVKLPRDRPITVNEGRVGFLHQNIFTRKVTDIAFTSDFCNNHSHPRPVRLCIWRPASPSQTSPRPILPYLMSPSPSLSHKRCPTHHRGQTSKSLFLFFIAGISFTS